MSRPRTIHDFYGFPPEFVDGYGYGSLSMTAYSLGLAYSDSAGVHSDAPPPAPEFPAEASNI